ncbi:MAG: LysR family transcriptional regulator [Betaproteobacteria bacterium]|nr:LysR family transcriptional regulator [Betaproteobacteria bacterium]
MELRDLEYFAVVARHGHVGRAAEALGLSQPALSKSLRRLEQTMQVRLVDRHPKGVSLTPAGETLLAQVDRLRLSTDDVRRAVSDVSAGRAGRLRVGAGAVIAGDLLSAGYGAYLKSAPDVEMHLTVDVTERLVPLLLDGELDLVVSVMESPAHPHLAQEYLFDDIMIVASSTRHRLARKKQVTLADVARERWALSAVHARSWAWMRRAFEENGLAPPMVTLIGPTSLRLPMVASSNLLGFCARRALDYAAAPYSLADLRVKDLEWTRRIAVSYRKDAYLSPTARRLKDILKNAAGSLFGVKIHR